MIPIPPRLLLKLIGGAAAIIAVWVAVAIVMGWRADAAKVPGLQQEIASDRKQHDEDMATLRGHYERHLKIARESSQEYLNELESLRAARPVLPRVVRLCTSPASTPADNPTSAAAASGPDEAATSPGLVPAAAGQGRDIGPDLYAIADRADELAAQCRALQTWATQVTSEPQPDGRQ